MCAAASATPAEGFDHCGVSSMISLQSLLRASALSLGTRADVVMRDSD